MAGYWIRHRFIHTVVICIAVALIASLLFVYPCIARQAGNYNSQSIYKNSDVDFIVPEPSFDQALNLPGTNGIDKVFPFFLTKTQINVNTKTRTTTVLLSDQFQNVGITMYNDARLIEKSGTTYDNPILVDWQFCHDTSAKLGDVISITIGGNTVEYRIAAIYETNSIYDGGAILAEISEEQKEAIAQQSSNNGYSGMYVSASDYKVCQAYLQSDYRPLGRLKSPDQFSSDEQYQTHYNAIMSSGYANEITDFRVRENSLNNSGGTTMVWIGALISIVIIICFNVLMARRGCEKVYFKQHCIPKGQPVKPYYSISFCAELFLSIVLYAVFLLLRVKAADEYVLGTAIGIRVAIVPVAIIIAEIIGLIMNSAMVTGITRQVELEMKKAREQRAREQIVTDGSDELPASRTDANPQQK